MPSSIELAEAVLTEEKGRGYWLPAPLVDRLVETLETISKRLHLDEQPSTTFARERLGEALTELQQLNTEARELPGKSAAKKWLIEQLGMGRLADIAEHIATAQGDIPDADRLDVNSVTIEELLKDIEWRRT